jgi:hypothetical protein
MVPLRHLERVNEGKIILELILLVYGCHLLTRVGILQRNQPHRCIPRFYIPMNRIGIRFTYPRHLSNNAL